MQQSNPPIVKYATRFKKVFNPPNPEDMVKYEQILSTSYTAVADGELAIILTELIGVLRIVQIEKEIKPLTSDDFGFNIGSGQITLAPEKSLAAGESLFIIYAKLITS